jgi:hypothetical protein
MVSTINPDLTAFKLQISHSSPLRTQTIDTDARNGWAKRPLPGRRDKGKSVSNDIPDLDRYLMLIASTTCDQSLAHYMLYRIQLHRRSGMGTAAGKGAGMTAKAHTERHQRQLTIFTSVIFGFADLFLVR